MNNKQNILSACVFILIAHFSSLAWANESKIKIDILLKEGALKNNIEARLPAYKPNCDANEDIRRSYQYALKAKLSQAERALGYYDAKNNIEWKQSEGCWLGIVTVIPGKPTIIKNILIAIQGNGKSDREIMTVYENVPFVVGDVLDHKQYSDYKDKLLQIAQQQGFLSSKFIKKEIRIDDKSYQAEVELILDTGVKYQFTDIEIRQNVLSKERLQRFRVISRGDDFSSALLIRQQQILQKSGYYSSVSVAPQYEKAKDGKIPLVIELKARKRNAYKLRFGYGTDTGLRTKARIERRWLGDEGRRLDIEAGLSEHINELSAQLSVPKQNPDRNSLYYTISYKQDQTNDLDSENFRVGVVYNSLRQKDWKRAVSLSYLDDRTAAIGESSIKSRLTLLGLEYSKVDANHLLYPTDGWRLRWEMEGALENILSDASVLRLAVHGKQVKDWGKGRFISRFDVGRTFGDGLGELPKDLRFFAGGINSVRGYSYQSLGEKDALGNVIGGKSLLETSIEYDYPFNESWSTAIFADAGNAFDDFSDTDLKLGVGAGLRWKTPIGAVRVDLAVPHDDTSDVHAHLSIGPDL